MTVKRWVTKYALTTGIAEVEGRWAGAAIDAGIMKYFYAMVAGRLVQFGPMDHHATREEAAARAKQMQQAKIKSLQSQLERVKQLEF